MEGIKIYTVADIEAERRRVGVKIVELCRAVEIDRQQYHRHRVTGRIWLDRANAMLKYIYAREKEQEQKQNCRELRSRNL